MSLRFCDPFACYTSSQIDRLYDTISVSGAIAVGPYGRSSSPGLRWTGVFSDFILKTLSDASGAIAIAQVDIWIDQYHSGGNTLLAFYDGGTVQVTLDLEATGELSVYRGYPSKTLLGTSTYQVPLNRWIHLGFKATIGNSGAAVVHVWEDGDTSPRVVLTLSGVDTQDTGAAQWDGVEIGAASNGETRYCNYVVLDGSGGINDDLLGPVDVSALRATARLVPALTSWPTSDGSVLSAVLGDGTPDDDVSYAYASATNARCSVSVAQVPVPTRPVLGVQSILCARKGGAGSPTLAPIVRQGTTVTVAATRSPGSAYSYLTEPYDRMPNGSTLTPSGVDALQWGGEAN